MMIVTDEKIFRDPSHTINGFSSIPYIFNINHYIVNGFWNKYIKQSGISRTYLPSEKHRLHFEQQLIKIIKSGHIVVCVKNTESYVPDELKGVVIYE